MTSGELIFTRYPDRESWLEARRFSIGSSDAAGIMGESSWSSPVSLNYQKRALSPMVSNDPERDEALEWHRRREDEIATWWWTRLQCREDNLYWKRAGQKVFMWNPGDFTVAVRIVDGVPLSATYDRVLLLDTDGARIAAFNIDEAYRGRNPSFWDSEDASALWAEIARAVVASVELKNAGAYMAKHWQEEPPLIYSLQLQHQLLVGGVKPGYMVASIGGQPPVWAEQLADGEVQGHLLAAYRRFWTSVTENEDLPPDYREVTSRAILARYPEDDESTVKLDKELLLWVKQFKNSHESAKSYKQLKEEAKNHLAQAIGAATFGIFDDGTQLSYKADSLGHRRLRIMGEETDSDEEWKGL